RFAAQLSRQYVASGVAAMESGDLQGAMPWFAEALRLDRDDPERSRMHRLRLTSLLKCCPMPSQVWWHDLPAETAPSGPPAARVLFQFRGHQARGGRAEVRDAVSGGLCFPPLPPDGSCVFADFHPDGRHLVTLTRDGRLRSWDAQTGKPDGVNFTTAPRAKEA